MLDEDHHIKHSSLKPLGIGLVLNFGLDYMHLVCLGVVRRLILYWKGPVGPLHVTMGGRAIAELSRKLQNLVQYIPREFSRKPRGIDEVPRWKATEFRQFLLYTGPVVLEGVASLRIYKHFMLLSCAISILSCQELSLEWCDYAGEFLVFFVQESERLYGRDILVYNVHCLVHLAQDVKNLGCLDNFSSFPFENMLGKLKKLIKKPQFPIAQIVCRLAEQDVFTKRTVTFNFETPLPKHEHHSGPLPMNWQAAEQFEQLQTRQWFISVHK